MKTIYTFFSLVIVTSLCHSQAYNGDGADELWSNTANWSNSTIVTSGNPLNIWNNPTNVDVDVEATQKNILNLGARTLDLSLSGVGTHKITVDNGNTNVNWAGQSTAYGVRNTTTEKTTMKVDCNIAFSNTEAGYTILNNSGHIENVIEMGPNSVLEAIGNGASGTWSDANVLTRKFNFNGEITGNKPFLFSKGAITFGATSNNSTFTGNFTFVAGSTVTVNSDNVFIDGTAANRLQANASAMVTLNTPNTMINGADFAVKNTNTFTVHMNANQNGLGLLMFVTDGGGTIELHMDAAVSEVAFGSNKLTDWQSGNVIIYGFKEGVISFGTDATGLDDEILPATEPKEYTPYGKLSNITAYTGMDASGSPVDLRIDESGKLHLLSTAGVDDNNSFGFSVYPNPVNNTLNIQSAENVTALTISDLVGQTVISQNANTSSVDVSSLTSGMYIVRLQAANGSVSTKKFIKK